MRDNLPNEFIVKVHALVEKIALEWLARPDRPSIDLIIVQNWRTLIRQWINSDLPIIVRKNGQAGQKWIHPSGRMIYFTDNAAAHRSMDLARKSEVPSLDMVRQLIEKDKFWKPGRTGASRRNGWKIAHVLPVGMNNIKKVELPISDYLIAFERLIDPGNMFLFPKEVGSITEIEGFLAPFREHKQ